MNTRGLDPGTGTRSPRTAGAAHLYHELREEILELRIRPGQELDEGTLAEQYGRSRTTVREALLNLSADRLVELLPNRGARVARLDFIELPRFIEAIDLVSRAVNWYAAERRSPGHLRNIETNCRLFESQVEGGDASNLTAHNRAFHMAVAEASDNSYLYATYRRLFDEGLRVMHLAFSRARSAAEAQTQHLDRVCSDHRALLEAIEQRDRQRAEALARSHTELFRARVFDYLKIDKGDVIGIEPSVG